MPTYVNSPTYQPRELIQLLAKEDKMWDKAWRAQQAHVHRPKEDRAHPLCGPLTERRPRLAHQVSKNLLYKEKTCSARRRLTLQGWDLLYKEKTCSARRRLALQGKDLLYKERRQDLTTIKRPQHPHKKVRVINSSLALWSCKNISDLTFGGCSAGSTPAPLEGVSVLFSLVGNGYERKDRAPYWWTSRHHH